MSWDCCPATFATALWSNEKDERLTQVHYYGYADYYKQMPHIFHDAKINLNIALRVIQTGIPLRVLDVMGCGGFEIRITGRNRGTFCERRRVRDL